jgi:hypothetical protein
MIAKALCRTAKISAIKLSHHVLHLNRLECDVIGQLIVQTAAGRGRKCVLSRGSSVWTREAKAF